MGLPYARVVVDANIVAGELTKTSVLRYVAAGHLTYFITEKQRSEAEHEVLRRLLRAEELGRISSVQVSTLLSSIEAALSAFVLVPNHVYADMNEQAARHVVNDPDDRPIAALALAFGCGIWTNDKTAFWGCGLPIWTFETLQRVYPLAF